MRVNVLSYEPAGGWILYDYAARLAQALAPHVDFVQVGFGQAPGFDVTFHVNYAPLHQILVPGLHCTMVTHIDTAEKFALVRAQAAAGVLGFCMSDETARRLNTLGGIHRFFNYAPPAMTEAPRAKLTVMVSGRLYEDGRKNEGWAIDFFRAFRPADLALRVMGAGWEPHLAALRRDGYAVEHAPAFDAARYRTWLADADHLLYTGHDEGALSTLDAMLHGVVPIATAQGYHLEQDGEILLFQTREQLLAIAGRLQRRLDETNEKRRRMTDWDGFARRHAEHWHAHMATLKAAA
jgi:hypothetical protein